MKTSVDVEEVVKFITMDLREESLKENKRCEWERIKGCSPLYKLFYSKCNYFIFEKADIEKSAKAIEIYKKYPVFECKSGSKLDDDLVYTRSDKSKIRMTADVMTSAGWLIGKFLSSNEGKNILDKISIYLYRAEKLSDMEKEIYESMNAFLNCVYTHGNFTVAGKNRGAGPGGCLDQWDCAMCGILECYESIQSKTEIEKNCILKSINEKRLNVRTNVDGYELISIVFENPIEDLFYQDYISEKYIIKDRTNIDWKYVFNKYTKLILRRGCRIYCAVNGYENSEQENDDIIKKAYSIVSLKEKY